MERRIEEINRFTVGWTAYYGWPIRPGRLRISTNGSEDGYDSIEASVSVTIVIENTTPTTVMTAAARVVRIWAAASRAPKTIHDGSVRPPSNADLSSACVPKYQRHCGDDFDCRDEPEVHPQRLPVPVGAQRNEGGHRS